MSAIIHEGDCRDVMRALDAETFAAICTDPPYGLSEHKPADVVECLTAWLAGREYEPKKRGFMGKAWDGWVPGPSYWLECYRVLKPGGHLVCFAGTRTQDLMGIAIRLAGFEVRDKLFWAFGSGFPKSHNLEGEWDGFGTNLKPAYEPVILARKPLIGTVAANVQAHGCGALNVDGCRVEGGERLALDARARVTPSQFGAMGGSVACGTTSEGRWPANLLLGCACPAEHAPECAVAMLDAQSGESASTQGHRDPNGSMGYHGGAGGTPFRLDGHADAGGASRFFYVAKASREEREAGLEHQSFLWVRWQWEGVDRKVRLRVGMGRSRPRVIAVSGAPSDAATAWSTLLFGSDTTAPFLKGCKFITATATSSTTRSKILNWLIRSLTSESTADASSAAGDGSSHAESAAPSILSITTTNAEMESLPGVGPVACGTLLQISASEKAVMSDGRKTPNNTPYLRDETQRRCDHPTVKPVSLMRWLVRLVGGKRGSAILDPFCGSGTTGVACALEGFAFTGVDLDAEHCEIARARILAASEQAGTATVEQAAQVPDKRGPVQLGLLGERET